MLDGKKTYISALVLALATLIRALGWVDQQQYGLILGLTGSAGLARSVRVMNLWEAWPSWSYSARRMSQALAAAQISQRRSWHRSVTHRQDVAVCSLSPWYSHRGRRQHSAKDLVRASGWPVRSIAW